MNLSDWTAHQFAFDAFVFLLSATVFGFLMMIVRPQDERRCAWAMAVCFSLSFWCFLGWVTS